MTRLFAIACALTFAWITPAAADDMVTRADGFDDFSKKFCATSRESGHIFVVDAAVFDEHESVTCDDGDSKLRVSEPTNDPGHKVFNIDPPHGSESGFDCDGKADIGMASVAINCIPASMETKDHKKS